MSAEAGEAGEKVVRRVLLDDGREVVCVCVWIYVVVLLSACFNKLSSRGQKCIDFMYNSFSR